jgi:biopolymer transport protein ExbD
MILSTQTNKPRSDSDDNLISLINVVFLMLIFFMVAGHISASDGVEVTPPLSRQEHRLTPSEFTLLVSPSGELYFNANVINLDDLDSLLKSESNDMMSPITVKADASVTMEKLDTVLQAIKQAGYARITLVTQGGHHD